MKKSANRQELHAFLHSDHLKEECLQHVEKSGLMAGWLFTHPDDSKHGTVWTKTESRLGIPRLVSRLLSFFELTLVLEPGFARRAVQAIPVGANLQSVWREFAKWLLTDRMNGLIRYAKTEQEKQAINDTFTLYNDENSTAKDWEILTSKLPDTLPRTDTSISMVLLAASEIAYVGWANSVALIEDVDPAGDYAFDQAAEHATKACNIVAQVFSGRTKQDYFDEVLAQADLFIELISQAPSAEL